MTDASLARNDAVACDDASQKVMSAPDVAALRKLLRPDSVAVHHGSRFETGHAYLDRNEQGEGPRNVAFAMRTGPTRPFDRAVVMTGEMKATVARGKERRPPVASVSRTWGREASGWSLVATASSGH